MALPVPRSGYLERPPLRGYAALPVRGGGAHEQHARARVRGIRQSTDAWTQTTVSLPNVPLSDSIFVGVVGGGEENYQPQQRYVGQDNVDWFMLGYVSQWGAQVSVWLGLPNGKGIPGQSAYLRHEYKWMRAILAEVRVDPGLRMDLVGTSLNATGGSTCAMAVDDRWGGWHGVHRARANKKNSGGIVISGIGLASATTPSGTSRPDIFRWTHLAQRAGLAIGNVPDDLPVSTTWNGTSSVSWAWTGLLR